MSLIIVGKFPQAKINACGFCRSRKSPPYPHFTNAEGTYAKSCQGGDISPILAVQRHQIKEFTQNRGPAKPPKTAHPPPGHSTIPHPQYPIRITRIPPESRYAAIKSDSNQSDRCLSQPRVGAKMIYPREDGSPFWSVHARKLWPAGKFEIGEEVLARDGEKTLRAPAPPHVPCRNRSTTLKSRGGPSAS